MMDKIIDCHMHFSAKGIFNKTAENIGLKCTLEEVQNEFKKNNIVLGIGMGVDICEENNLSNPQIIYHGKEKFPPFLAQCLGINTLAINKENLKDTLDSFKQKLEENSTVGLKIYTGYQPYLATDKKYRDFYKLAQKYDVPVVFHMGDTANSMGKLKYSQPLIIDEVAVDFPKVKFVIAHCGTPWVADAVEVVAKNKNVYMDLSGLMEGKFKAKKQIKEFKPYLNIFRTWFNYLHDYQKLMYGSDWPLVDMKDYIKVIQSIIPKKAYDDVFYHNALKVFDRLPEYLKKQEKKIYD